MKLKPYLVAPILFVLCLLALLATWAAMEPAALRSFFDADGYSPFELATLPFYAAIVPLVWWKCPFTGSPRRRALLCAAVSCVAVMAVVKEMDLHLMAIKALFPEVVNANGSVHGLVKPDGTALTGTPFKMRFLTNAGGAARGEGVRRLLLRGVLRRLRGSARVLLPAAREGLLRAPPRRVDDVLLRHVRRDGAALRPDAGVDPPCARAFEIRYGRFGLLPLHGPGGGRRNDDRPLRPPRDLSGVQDLPFRGRRRREPGLTST